MNEIAYTALRTRAAYIDLAGRGNIRVTGEDRARLLHAMCTNHVQQLIPGTGCYAFFLTAQGRILADANIFCMPDYLLLDTEPEARETLRQHLDNYIIADDAVLEDFTGTMAAVALEGPAAEEVMKGLGGPAAHMPYAIAQWEHGLVAHVSYTGGPGYIVFTPAEQRADLIARFGAAGLPEARLAEAEAVRLEHGRPRHGVDFSDANIPQETQVAHAVHASKGCYLGQEIVERVRSRGHVNRQLATLEFDTDRPPLKGAKVRAGEAEAGEIRSAVYSPALGVSLAIALVRVEALAGALTVDGVSARVRRARS